MHPPRIRVSPLATTCHSCLTFGSRPPSILPLTLIRHSASASQGRANKGSQPAGKRLGAKKAASELVVPGNIIFRQRGTLWFPGENCGMGRDHTIFAKEKGYVTFYRDPETHPKRKYIGIVFQRGEKLPVPRNAPRRRRLGLMRMERELSAVDTVPPTMVEGESVEVGAPAIAQETTKPKKVGGRKRALPANVFELKPGYQYRESNWSIGRTADRANIRVRRFKKSERSLSRKLLIARKVKRGEIRPMSNKKGKRKPKRR